MRYSKIIIIALLLAIALTFAHTDLAVLTYTIDRTDMPVLFEPIATCTVKVLNEQRDSVYTVITNSNGYVFEDDFGADTSLLVASTKYYLYAHKSDYISDTIEIASLAADETTRVGIRMFDTGGSTPYVLTINLESPTGAVVSGKSVRLDIIGVPGKDIPSGVYLISTSSAGGKCEFNVIQNAIVRFRVGNYTSPYFAVDSTMNYGTAVVKP